MSTDTPLPLDGIKTCTAHPEAVAVASIQPDGVNELYLCTTCLSIRRPVTFVSLHVPGPGAVRM